MKTNTIEKVKILKEHLLNTYPDGKFSANGYAFNKIVGSGSSPYYLSLLVKDGFLKMIKKTTKEGKKWIPAEYEIVGYIVNDVKVENNIDNNVNNDIESNIEDNKEMQSKVDVNDFIEEEFNNIPMRLYMTEKGYVVPINNIAKALNSDSQMFHQLLHNYKELFETWRINVTLKGEKSTVRNTCLTRDGVIGLLMKISYNRLTPDKKKLVLEFQKWAIEKLGLLMSTGEVKISNQEQNNIQTNVANVIGVSNEDIEKLLINIRNSLDDNIKKVKSLFDGKNEEILLAKSERDIANEREKQVLAKVSQMVDQRFQIMLNKMA